MINSLHLIGLLERITTGLYFICICLRLYYAIHLNKLLKETRFETNLSTIANFVLKHKKSILKYFYCMLNVVFAIKRP